MLPESLDPDTLRWVSIGVVVLLALVVLFVVRTTTKIATKLVLVLVLAGLGALVWWQRAELSDCANTCDCEFVGFKVQVPEIADCP